MAGNNEVKEIKKQQKPKKKGGIKKFFKEFIGEVKKLSWATPKENFHNTLTVFAVIAIFAVLIGICDFLFGAGFQWLANLKG